MSKYQLSFQRLQSLKGQIGRNLYALKAKLEVIDTLPDVQMQQYIPYRGRWFKGVCYRGAIKMLHILYRFLDADSEMVIESKANAVAAQTVDLAAESEVAAAVKANLMGAPVQNMRVDRSAGPSVFARLVAYYRSAAVYDQDLHAHHTAQLTPAEGAAARYEENIGFDNTFAMIAADAVPADGGDNPLDCQVKAASCAAETLDVSVEQIAGVETLAATVSAEAAAVVADAAISVSHTANLATWYYPEFVDGVLHIRQAYGLKRNGSKLEVE